MKNDCVPSILYRLNLSNPNLYGREVMLMPAKKIFFSASVYKGCLVINGSNE